MPAGPRLTVHTMMVDGQRNKFHAARSMPASITSSHPGLEVRSATLFVLPMPLPTRSILCFEEPQADQIIRMQPDRRCETVEEPLPRTTSSLDPLGRPAKLDLQVCSTAKLRLTSFRPVSKRSTQCCPGRSWWSVLKLRWSLAAQQTCHPWNPGILWNPEIGHGQKTVVGRFTKRRHFPSLLCF